MLLVIDNFDSFTYNLVQYFGELGVEQQVYRNNAITVEEALALNPDRVMISPGPCSPNEAGVSLAMIESTAIYCFVVAMILIFANPFWTAAVEAAQAAGS